IAIGACEQCGRNRPPEIHAPLALDAWLNEPATVDDRLLLHPDSTTTLRSLVLAPLKSVLLLIGPEGGLSQAERDAAIESGFRAVSLGPRILRTETTALAALSLLQGMAGDL